MSGLTDYLPALTVGTDVINATGKGADGLTAGGYAAFITAVTGSAPKIVALPDRRANIVLSQDQIVKLQSWLDTQLFAALKPSSEKPSLTLDLGPAIVPWALKFIVPAALLLVVLGWTARNYLGGR